MSSYRRISSWFYHWFWTGLDWLYPPQCAGCGAEAMRLCYACRKKVQRVIPPVCAVCGYPQAAGLECQRCITAPPYFAQLRSWAFFNGVIRKAILRLKYQRDLGLGEVLSQYLVRAYLLQEWHIDAVIPVPLSLDRQAMRGYNQASVLAKPFALSLGLEFRPQALARVRETRSQVGLSAQERQNNVQEAFLANPELVNSKKILVIDDVTTTGSTLNACAAALKDAGAAIVYCLTLARAAKPVTNSN